ncbi:S8 family peptidase [Algoriphagus formosus]|uniref:S8 family peptidase n=1 Tax=Algoriphagus formosus TaxID=2007308 RepID=UPI003F72D891
MRNLILISVLFLGFSCQDEKDPLVESKTLEENSYEIVFNEDSGITPLADRQGILDLDSVEFEKVLTSLEDSIRQIIIDIEPNIPSEKISVRVFSEVSVHLQGLSKDQLMNFESKAQANKFQVLVDINLQGRRPMMQSALIPQGRRPMMQEQMRYDAAKQTSVFIEEIGGGQQVNPIPATKVWIIDSGIDSSHTDLSFQREEIRLSKDYSKGDTTGKYPFLDKHGHGTQIAGIIGAKSSSSTNDYGMNGVFPNARMVSIKIFNGKGETTFASLNNALNYVSRKAQKGDIVNLSLGFSIDDDSATPPQIQNAIRRLTGFLEDLVSIKEAHVVMSAGNDAELSTRNLPGGLIISSDLAHTIASYGHYYNPTNGQNERLFSFFSNYNIPTVDYIEPGEYIFTTAPKSSYAVVSGTSFSAAIFSGILYHGSSFDTLGTVLRGPDASGNNPPYPIAKVR